MNKTKSVVVGEMEPTQAERLLGVESASKLGHGYDLDGLKEMQRDIYDRLELQREGCNVMIGDDDIVQSFVVENVDSYSTVWFSVPVFRCWIDGKEVALHGAIDRIEIPQSGSVKLAVVALSVVDLSFEPEWSVVLDGLCYMAAIAAPCRYTAYTELGRYPTVQRVLQSCLATEVVNVESMENGMYHVVPGEYLLIECDLLPDDILGGFVETESVAGVDACVEGTKTVNLIEAGDPSDYLYFSRFELGKVEQQELIWFTRPVLRCWLMGDERRVYGAVDHMVVPCGENVVIEVQSLGQVEVCDDRVDTNLLDGLCYLVAVPQDSKVKAFIALGRFPEVSQVIASSYATELVSVFPMTNGYYHVVPGGTLRLDHAGLPPDARLGGQLLDSFQSSEHGSDLWAPVDVAGVELRQALQGDMSKALIVALQPDDALDEGIDVEVTYEPVTRVYKQVADMVGDWGPVSTFGDPGKLGVVVLQPGVSVLHSEIEYGSRGIQVFVLLRGKTTFSMRDNRFSNDHYGDGIDVCYIVPLADIEVYLHEVLAEPEFLLSLMMESGSSAAILKFPRLERGLRIPSMRSAAMELVQITDPLDVDSPVCDYRHTYTMFPLWGETEINMGEVGVVSGCRFVADDIGLSLGRCVLIHSPDSVLVTRGRVRAGLVRRDVCEWSDEVSSGLTWSAHVAVVVDPMLLDHVTERWMTETD